MATPSDMADSLMSTFESAHSIAVFYMFIQEEAIQAVGLSIFMAYKNEDYEEMKDLARYCKYDLVKPLLELADSKLGKIAYPMNKSFKAFAEAQLKSLDYYLNVET